jgi:hypothetical protein
MSFSQGWVEHRTFPVSTQPGMCIGILSSLLFSGMKDSEPQMGWCSGNAVRQIVSVEVTRVWLTRAERRAAPAPPWQLLRVREPLLIRCRPLLPALSSRASNQLNRLGHTGGCTNYTKHLQLHACIKAMQSIRHISAASALCRACLHPSIATNG